jgi:hypothetical protein
MISSRIRFIALVASAAGMFVLAGGAGAQVSTGPGFIYASLPTSDLTQSCVQAGPGGTFVGQGPGFTANGQRVVLVRESGVESVVATGFNSISDCVYDAETDTLYVTDNSGELAGAVTGDTVFAIAAASSAPGATAVGNEVVVAGSLPFAAGVTIDAAGDVYVSSSGGGGSGAVAKIAAGAITPIIAGLDFASGLAFDSAGDLLVAETLASFDSRVTRWSAEGSLLDEVATPSFDFGSYDAAFALDGRLIVTGAFAGDVVSMDPVGGSTSPLVGGLTFATGVDVDAFTGRVSLLSSTFIPNDEDRSVHRLVDKARLIPGNGSDVTECMGEIYGAELVPLAPEKPAKHAVCVDGASCDADGVANDVCVFPIGVCLNVVDSRFSDCASADVAALTVKKSKPVSMEMAALAAAVQTDAPLVNERCYFSDGMRVPVKVTRKGARKDGKGMLKLQVVGSGTRPVTDTDSLKMVCLPPAS